MARFILRRLGAGIILIFATSFVAFNLLILGSGNVGRNQLGFNATEEQVAARNAQLGLDRPVLAQYLSWLRKAITGDFGKSWSTPQSVTDAISSRLGVTLTIAIGAVLLAAVIGILSGVIGALRGGTIDRVIQSIALVGFALPGFLIAFGLVTLFAIKLGWFSATVYTRPGESISGWIKSVTLPIVALALSSYASVALQVRGAVKDTLGFDYVRTLRARGLASNRITYKHVLRNSAGPALSIIGLQFISLLGGAVVVEKVFNLPGVGQLAVGATTTGDVPLVMGVVVFTAVVVVLVNLAIDLATGWLNPKVRAK